MNKSLKIILSLLSIAVCSVLLFLFRTIPVSSIWKNYNLVYVENSLSEDIVLTVLKQYRCADIISAGVQKQPVTSIYTPVELGRTGTYLYDRSRYFSDKSESYNVFYVPEEFNQGAVKAVNQLKKEYSVNAGIDSRETMFWFLPVICALILIVLTAASKNKYILPAMGIIPVGFVLAKPFFPFACAVILLLLSIYLCEKYFTRKEAGKVVAESVYTILPASVSLVIVFVYSVKTGLLYLAVIFAEFMMFVLIRTLYEISEKKKSFTFTNIVPARLIPVITKDSSGYILFSSAAMLVILMLFFISTRFSGASSFNGIALPSPAEELSESEDSLPVIQDYYDWVWNTITYPYKNLHEKRQDEKVQIGDRITYTEYENTPSGIVASEKIIYEFNEEFTDAVNENIKQLEYPAIEKLLMEQKDTVSVTYSTSAKSSGQKKSLSLILIICGLFIPLFLYFYYSITGRKI